MWGEDTPWLRANDNTKRPKASFGNRGAQTKGESTHMGIGLIPSHHPIHVYREGFNPWLNYIIWDDLDW